MNFKIPTIHSDICNSASEGAASFMIGIPEIDEYTKIVHASVRQIFVEIEYSGDIYRGTINSVAIIDENYVLVTLEHVTINPLDPLD